LQIGVAVVLVGLLSEQVAHPKFEHCPHYMPATTPGEEVTRAYYPELLGQALFRALAVGDDTDMTQLLLLESRV
jgi:hypothetical protein